MKILALLAVVFATSASANWKPANPQAAEAADNPRVAAVLREVDNMDAAIVTGDKAGFVGRFADDAIINSPYNNISTRDQAAARYRSGQLTYKYLHRSIEYAAPRRDDEVVLMGEETYEPPAGAPMAGKIVRRRFTDLWRLEGSKWKLSLRQATVFEARPTAP